MNHPLNDQHPERIVSVTDFTKQHPELMPERRARNHIDQINRASAPEAIRKIFRKRFNRWFVHVPSLVDYLEKEESLLESA